MVRAPLGTHNRGNDTPIPTPDRHMNDALPAAPAEPVAPRRVAFGHVTWPFPSTLLGELTPTPRDGTGRVGAASDRLRATLAEHGYLFLRGAIDREAVRAARARVLHYMADSRGLEPGSRPLDGVMGATGRSVRMMGRPAVTHHPAVRRVLEAPELVGLHREIQGGDVMTYDYKWLRAVGHEEFTGAHMDHVYMGRGSPNVLTTWIPLDDIPIERGTLAVCEGSHRLDGFARVRDTYGAMDVDRDRVAGWFSNDPGEIRDRFGGRWLTADMRAGDVLVFGLHLMHASTTNTTDRWRLSCDVRFQPVDEPVDLRWVGRHPAGHTDHGDAARPMAELRRRWGV